MVRIPGSSANLGAGFDCLGLALELFVEVAGRPRRGEARVVGPAGLPADDSNLIWRAFSEILGSATPDWELEVRNEIPLRRGLGSSGAAAVAGVALANQAGNLGLTPAAILARAAALEGHADNVAASVYGGLAVVAGPQVITVPWPEEIQVLAAIPELELATAEARAALPDTYARTDAVFNLQRAAMFVAAVATRDTAALRTAMEDRLHQPYRTPLVPGLRDALALRVPGLLGVALSGAGPSLIALVSDSQPTRQALAEIYRRIGIACEVRSLAVARQGIRYL
jgi:homoserine kinase